MHHVPSYAIFSEFAKSNLRMQNGLNRRIFNTTEALRGTDIRLGEDGVVHLSPGTYRITGFSMVTMQVTMDPPKVKSNYPGYCLVYDLEEEADPRDKHISVGTPATSAECTPSQFEFVLQTDRPRRICLGHQSGNNLLEPIYLTLYEIGTETGSETSPYHLFAKMAIYKMD